MPKGTLRIGQVAARAGVNVETLRFYERRGLLQPPTRDPSSRYREYPEETVRVVRFIKRAQGLGFTLREAQELLRLRDYDEAPCEDVRAAATSKIEDIDGKMKTLRAMKVALTKLVASCSLRGAKRSCPILDAPDDPGRGP